MARVTGDLGEAPSWRSVCGVSTTSWGEAFVALVCIEQPHLKVSLLWRSGALSHRTSPTEISTRKSVNFGINLRLPRASVISIPELFTYALYLVIAIVLEVIYILLSHKLLVLLSISCWCT